MKIIKTQKGALACTLLKKLKYILRLNEDK
uniref:Uncharacterized protein n=1 Tax=Anguilla anguilla TaxID=7936 RepID=A0A0E9PHP2_ANGAN